MINLIIVIFVLIVRKPILKLIMIKNKNYHSNQIIKYIKNCKNTTKIQV